MPFRWRCPGCRASSRPGAGACPARCGDRLPPRCHGPGKGRRIPRCSAGNRRPGWKMIYIYILIVSWDYYSHILWKNIKCSNQPTRYSHISSYSMSRAIYSWNIYNNIYVYIPTYPYFILVGSIPIILISLFPLKNMKVSWDDYSHILWNNTKCSKPPTRYSHISIVMLAIYIYITIYRNDMWYTNCIYIYDYSRENHISIASWQRLD